MTALGTLALRYLPHLLALALVVGGILYVAGLSADRDRWRVAAGDWKGHAVAWERHSRGVAKLRRAEGRQAVNAVQEASRACDARVADARKSSAAIRTIIQKVPTYDQNHCPVRERVDPGLLRDALRPRGQGPAGG